MASVCWFVGCEDSKEALNSCDCWWSLWPSDFWNNPICAHGSVWIHCPCCDTWFYIKEMACTRLEARLACDNRSQWNSSKIWGPHSLKIFVPVVYLFLVWLIEIYKIIVFLTLIFLIPLQVVNNIVSYLNIMIASPPTFIQVLQFAVLFRDWKSSSIYKITNHWHHGLFNRGHFLKSLTKQRMISFQKLLTLWERLQKHVTIK